MYVLVPLRYLCVCSTIIVWYGDYLEECYEFVIILIVSLVDNKSCNHANTYSSHLLNYYNVILFVLARLHHPLSLSLTHTHTHTHTQAYIPLVTVLLAISEQHYFLNHWHGFLMQAVIPSIKVRPSHPHPLTPHTHTPPHPHPPTHCL